MLQNLEYTSRQIKGTMEVRKLMRFDTNAARIRRGVSIFVTFSPDEKHNLLMLRLHRSREHDPVHLVDENNKRYGQRTEPPLDMEVSLDVLGAQLPTYDERRSIMARDALASVYGFRITILVTLEYIFGMRVCIHCPDCNHDPEIHSKADAC